MPQPFSDPQRQRIRRRLLDVAADHFARYGYRKANVAEIARGAGIAKGSLYLFFDSKAALFIAVAREAEAEIRRQLLEELVGPFPSHRARLRHFFRFQFDVLQQHPLIAVLTEPDEARSLMRELPEGVFEEIAANDDAFFAALAREWQRERKMKDVEPRLLAALARAIYAMSLQHDLIGPDLFPRVVETTIDGLSRSLEPERGTDR